jgi:sulfotransferase family protein
MISLRTTDKERKSAEMPLLPDKNEPSLKVIITGSPRAGTSFVAGLVSRLGFNAGPQDWLRPPDSNNPQGYYECTPLISISERMLQKLGGDFHHPPSLPHDWLVQLAEECREVCDIVAKGQIEMYKGNRLLILAGAYHELFPKAKWVFVHRDVHDTHRSRFGAPIPLEEWKALTEARLSTWRRSAPCATALVVEYASFKLDFEGSLKRLAQHLGVELTESMLLSCRGFFKPRGPLSMLVRSLRNRFRRAGR